MGSWESLTIAARLFEIGQVAGIVMLVCAIVGGLLALRPTRGPPPPARAKWRMLVGMTLILGLGLAVVWSMAILELVSPRIAETWSNCWWYAMVKFWKDGGAVVMRQSSYTTIQHFDHTFDLETFTTFNPPRKVRRFLPPPFFTGTQVTVTRAQVLKEMAPKVG